jgi:hypothetical protein
MTKKRIWLPFVALMFASALTSTHAVAQQTARLLTMEGLVMSIPNGMEIGQTFEQENLAIVAYQRPSPAPATFSETLIVMARALDRPLEAARALSENLYRYNDKCGGFDAVQDPTIGLHGFTPADSYVVSLCANVRLAGDEMVRHEFQNEFAATRMIVAGGTLYYVQYLFASNDTVGHHLIQSERFRTVIHPAMLSMKVAP